MTKVFYIAISMLLASPVASAANLAATSQSFGVKCDNADDDTVKLQSALKGLTNGGRLHIMGTCRVSATLNIPSNVVVEGDGVASRLHFTHEGDGLKTLSSINSSTAKYVVIRDLAVYNDNPRNSGGGYVDIGGTYITVENVQFSGWKYGIIFDQTEIATVTRSFIIGWKSSGVWLVNGPDHSNGARAKFTNRITISENQFNGKAGFALQDDGGVNHLIVGNNFNAGSTQIYAAGVSGLSIVNNEMEGASAYPIYLAEKTVAGSYAGATTGLDVSGNTIGDGLDGIFMQSVQGGRITSNVFYQYRNYALELDFGENRRVSGLDVSGNSKATFGPGRTAGPFVNPEAVSYWESQGNYLQNGQTYVPAALMPGMHQVIPATMEGIYNGVQLRVMNVDGTNVETVVCSVNPAAPSSFRAVFTKAKTAGWLVNVIGSARRGSH